MPLFVCSKCKVIENTALCGYWYRKGEPLCSECDPQFKKWHNRFPRQKFNNEEWEKEDGDFVRRI